MKESEESPISTLLSSGDKVRYKGDVHEVAYHVPTSNAHPSYIVLKNGGWVFPREVTLVKPTKMRFYNGIALHSFLDNPTDIEVEEIAAGTWGFRVHNSKESIVSGDIILKWSQEQTHRCILRVTRIEPKHIGDTETVGEARDLVFYDEVTLTIQRLVSMEDKTVLAR